MSGYDEQLNTDYIVSIYSEVVLPDVELIHSHSKDSAFASKG